MIVINSMNVLIVAIIQVLQLIQGVDAGKESQQPLSKFRDRQAPVNIQAPMVHLEKDQRPVLIQNLFCSFENL